MENLTEIIKLMKIMYVEDEEISKTIMKKVLKKKTKNVFIASNGKEGLEAFKLYKPDIVITEIIMPVLDGMDMIKEIRNIDQNCGIIITTEIDNAELILKSIDVGIDKYIIKPIDEEKIDNAIKIVLNKMFKRKAYEEFFNSIIKVSPEEKKFIEENIKIEMSNFLKKNVGKGPKYVEVVMIENIIEVKSHDILTCLEKTLIEHNNNLVGLVKSSREIVYSSKKRELEQIIGNIVKGNISMEILNINILKNEDKIIFRYYI